MAANYYAAVVECSECGTRCNAPSLVRHRGSERCRALKAVREMRDSGLEPVGKHWGAVVQALGARVVRAPVGYSAYGSNGVHTRYGFWVEPRYAAIVNTTKVPALVRRLMLAMAVDNDQRLAAVEAALKLDPSGRAASTLLKSMHEPLDKPVKPDTMVPPGAPPGDKEPSR